MKIELTVNGTAKAIKMMAGAIDARPVIPAMGGISISTEGSDTVVLRVMNATYEVIRKIPADVKEAGAVILDGKRLAAIFNSVNGNRLTIDAPEGKPNATIKCAGSKFTVAVLTGELPQKQDVDKEKAVTAEISCGELVDGLSHVRYAVSIEETRMELTGVLTQIGDMKMTLVALDGFRMGLSRKECFETNGEMDVTIPAQSVDRILSMCSEADGSETVYMETDGKAVYVQTANAELKSSLVAGKFIDYKKIVPRDAQTSVRFDASMFLGALKRAEIAATNKLFRLAVRDGEMEIMANDPTGAIEFSEIIPCQKMGNDVETAYNIRYALDTLNAIGSGETQLDLKSATTPGLMKPADGGKQLHVILPVRVVNG